VKRCGFELCFVGYYCVGKRDCDCVFGGDVGCVVDDRLCFFVGVDFVYVQLIGVGVLFDFEYVVDDEVFCVW